ncbi:MAG: non-lysosomal glucosylceramidase [Candidatus Omnitrophica bacterium]|nr:non-lysosomal glucosylceramidase [Candidatus Omnitrophota bacterium]
MKKNRLYNSFYFGEYLNRVAFPLGGIGAGMLCLEGTGALSHVSFRHQPDLNHEPCLFSAICIKGRKNVARVLEGPVPGWKIMGRPGAGNGLNGTTYGLPRLAESSFLARFPFGQVFLKDPVLPLEVTITGWSPFIPGESDHSSLPVAALEFTFTNKLTKKLDLVYSFNSKNFMAVRDTGHAVTAIEGGFVLRQAGSKERPWEQGDFAAFILEKSAAVNTAWFRGGWFDSLTLAWQEVASGQCVSRPEVKEEPASPGGSLFVPLSVPARGKNTVTLLLCWYVPESALRVGPETEPGTNKSTYRPWYIQWFSQIEQLVDYWRKMYPHLKEKSQKFSECFYDTSLPPEVVEAVAANLTILKSPTVLRQVDGRLWCWEGCGENKGCCHGSCTHVWNYAQAIAHLFPDLEWSLRETEFGENQAENGHQSFRASLPIRPTTHDFHAAADGQLGGLVKVYRDWRISGDTGRLKKMWPKVKASLNYCISTFDPDQEGILKEPHHNTYDIEFWGPDGMCGTFYLAALKAALEMAQAIGETIPLYQALYQKGRTYLEEKLFNGEYFCQEIRWQGLRAGDPLAQASQLPIENRELIEKEGPKYQYGTGCLADGILGVWLAAMSGLDDILDRRKIRQHLRSVFRYNFRKDLSTHANPERPGFALGKEAGLVLCTWPKGKALTLPFPYAHEVWTGCEYQVASHLIWEGMVEEGLTIVRAARDRYDGRVRNPFDEYECGHWYGRALSSYGLFFALTGVRYDAVEKTLYIRPRISRDFRSFLSTASGYGTVGVKNGRPFLRVRQGTIDIARIDYQKNSGKATGKRKKACRANGKPPKVKDR